MLQAFDVVEKSYFETIDDALAEKANLSSYHPPQNEVRRQLLKCCFTEQAENGKESFPWRFP